MLLQDLHLLPKFRDGLSYLYVEHCRVEQEARSIALYDRDGKTPVPCASLSVLMLGPGTSISHAAVQSLADNGCLAIWCGEEGVRFYAMGMGESRNARNLIHQARLASDPSLRLKVVRRMYEMRFEEPLDENLTLEQIRGMEGIRIRTAYSQASRETGIPWAGRSYDRGSWKRADPVNRALSVANSCLYGICHAGIVAMGYSPALGFIHTGKQMSFVYDVADLYKVEVTIPVDFLARVSDSLAAGTEGGDLCRQRIGHGERQVVGDGLFKSERWGLYDDSQRPDGTGLSGSVLGHYKSPRNGHGGTYAIQNPKRPINGSVLPTRVGVNRERRRVEEGAWG